MSLTEGACRMWSMMTISHRTICQIFSCLNYIPHCLYIIFKARFSLKGCPWAQSSMEPPWSRLTMIKFGDGSGHIGIQCVGVPKGSRRGPRVAEGHLQTMDASPVNSWLILARGKPSISTCVKIEDKSGLSRIN